MCLILERNSPMPKKTQQYQHYYHGRGGYVPFYYEIMDSTAYKSLSPKSRCLLMELQRREFPNKNGFVGMSEKRAADILDCAENTASKAFEELINRGFIIRNFDGDYTRGLASEWIITYLQYQGREPTHDWKHYKIESQP